jgi:hypothetical protein
MRSSTGSFSPPSRRGGRADLINVTPPPVIGAAGEVRNVAVSYRVSYGFKDGFNVLMHDFVPVSDLPGRTDSKVARHLLDRRVRPSSKEGIADSRFASGTRRH